jgi:peptidoglycan LD-endopeptidase LytH
VTATPLSDRDRLGTRRKAALRLILAFVLMLGVALALMVNFTDGTIAPAPPAPVRSEDAPVLVVPVAGVSLTQITDTWGQSRDSGARPHQGTDIMAPAGTPVLAAAAGTVEKLFDSKAGGHTLYLRSADGRWSYYYAHLAGYAPGIAEGKQVRAGERIAFVGDTGNAGAGNYHLHFGISRMNPEDGWWQGEPVNPYPLLVGNQPGR